MGFKISKVFAIPLIFSSFLFGTSNEFNNLNANKIVQNIKKTTATRINDVYSFFKNNSLKPGFIEGLAPNDVGINMHLITNDGLYLPVEKNKELEQSSNWHICKRLEDEKNVTLEENPKEYPAVGSYTRKKFDGYERKVVTRRSSWSGKTYSYTTRVPVYKNVSRTRFFSTPRYSNDKSYSTHET